MKHDHETGLFVAWFAFCALLSLGMVGLIAWAIVRLVVHFT